MSEALDNALGVASGVTANPSYIGDAQYGFNAGAAAWYVSIGPDTWEFKNAALYINGVQFVSGVGTTFFAEHDPTKSLKLGNVAGNDFTELSYDQTADRTTLAIGTMKLEMTRSGTLLFKGLAIDQASVVAAAQAAMTGQINSIAAAQAQTTATSVATTVATNTANTVGASAGQTAGQTAGTTAGTAAGETAGAAAGEAAGEAAALAAVGPAVAEAESWAHGDGVISGGFKSSRGYALDAAGILAQVQDVAAGIGSGDGGGTVSAAQTYPFLDVGAGRLLRRSDLKKQLRFTGTGTAIFQVPPNLFLTAGQYDYIDFQPINGGLVQVVPAPAVTSSIVHVANTTTFRSWSETPTYPSDGLIGAAQNVDFPTGTYLSLIAMGVATADAAAAHTLELVVDGVAYPNLLPPVWTGDEANRVPVAFVIPIGDKTQTGNLAVQPKISSFGGLINLALGFAFYSGLDQAQPYQPFSQTADAPAGAATGYASSVANPDTTLTTLLLMGVAGNDAGTITTSGGTIRAAGTVGNATTGSTMALIGRTSTTVGNIATTLGWTQSRRHVFASLRLLRNNGTVVTIAAPAGRNISPEANGALSLLLYPDNKCALRAV